MGDTGAEICASCCGLCSVFAFSALIPWSSTSSAGGGGCCGSNAPGASGCCGCFNKHLNSDDDPFDDDGKAGDNPKAVTGQEKNQETVPANPARATDIPDAGTARDGGSGTDPSVTQKQPGPTTEMVVPAH